MSKVKFKYGTAEQLANAPYLEGTFYVISDDNSIDGILYADLHGNRICFGDVASLVKKVSKLESSAQDTKFEVDWLRSNIIKNTIEKDTTINANDVHTVPPQEVVIYGKSEQNETPTPVTPISINSLDNEFTLHVAKNGIADYGDWPVIFDLENYVLRGLPDETCDVLRISYSKPSEDAGWALYDATLEQAITSIALADLEWTQLSNGIFQGKNIPNSANGVIGTHQILCDTYQEIETQFNSADMNGNDNKTIAFQDDYPYIFVKDTDYINLDDFIASLGTSIINYPLATPIVHSLGIVELPALPNPMIAWVDDGNVQPAISITYEVDNKIYNSNLIHAETDISLDDIRNKTNALENIGEILTNRLIAIKADINSLEVTKANIDSLEAAEAKIDELEVSSATIQNLEAANARIGDLETDNLAVKRRLSAAEADIGNLEAINVNVTGRLRATEADIEELTASKADIIDLTAATARIGSLETDNVNVKGRLSATEADIENLEATTATIESLNATEARIGTLEANKANVTDLTAATGRILTLEANTADINTIRANSAKVANLTAQELEADHATIGSLDANFAQVNMANVNNAWIQNGTVKDGAISNAMINSVSANKLTAGTIDASNITVTNLNANNITTGTINGQRIGTGSLSLDKLEENVYTEDEINSIVDNLQNQIDGAIETWTGTEIPTLSNTPASDWITDSIKDRHVGDIYFIVNSQSDQSGYNYRFTKIGNTYSWQLIKDSDVTQVLQRLTDAEGKIGDIEQFDTTISSWKNDTDEELRSIKSAATTLAGRVTTAEGTLQTKVDTTTFNTLSQTVDGHSSSITQLTTETSTLTQAVDTLNTKTSSDSGNIIQFSDSIGFKEIVVHGKSIQNGTPTPDAPVEIESIDDLTLHVCGKNLFRAPTWAEITSSEYTISYYHWPIYLKPNTTYYVSNTDHDGYTSIETGYYLLFSPNMQNGSWKSIAHSTVGATSGTITTDDSGIIYLAAYGNQAKYEAAINGVYTMLTEGSTATDYEPYQGQAIDIPLGDHQIRSLPDGTDDTLTFSYIGPSIREGWGLYNTELVQKINTEILDGSESGWTKSTGYPGGYYLNAWSYTRGITSSNKHIQDHFITANNIGEYSVGTCLFDNSLNFRFDNTEIATLNDFTSWLSQNPVTVQYVLATPIVHNLGVVELPLSEDLNLWATTSPSTTIDATWWHEAGRVEKNAIDISNASNDLYNTKKSTILPKPYRQVEWVEFCGKQFIRLDWRPGFNGAFGFDADFITYNSFNSGSYSTLSESRETNETRVGAIFGVRGAGATVSENYGPTYTYYALQTYNGYGVTNGFVCTGGQKIDAKLYTDKRRQQCSLLGDIYTAPDGTQVTVDRSGYLPSNGDMYVGAIRTASGTASPKLEAFSSTRIYSLKFYDDTTLVLDLVPAVRKMDNVGGLYDKINEMFYPSIGTLIGDVLDIELGKSLTITEKDALSNQYLADLRTGPSRLIIVQSDDIKQLIDGQEITFTSKYPTASQTYEAAGITSTSYDPAASNALMLRVIDSNGNMIGQEYPIYYNASTVATTQYDTGQSVTVKFCRNVVFNTTATPNGWFADANYDTNTNTNDTFTRLTDNAKAGLNGLKRYTLCMRDENGLWTSIVNEANDITTIKTCYTGGLMPSKVCYHATAEDYASNAKGGVLWESYGTIDFRYSLNIGTTAATGLVQMTPIYLVGTISSTDGLFYLDTEQWWTQNPQDENKIYIFISQGRADYYRSWLAGNNPMYIVSDGELVEYTYSRITRNTNKINETIDTVDEHARKIGILETTVENKADGSDLTTISNRLNTVSDTVDGHTQSISSLNTTITAKADSSSVETISNRVNSISDTVDGHTQSISSINETLETKVDSSTVNSLTTKVNNISDTVDGHTQTIGSVQNTQTQMQGKLNKTIVETTQLWYSKANTEAPAKPTSQITSTSTDGNAWRIVVPVYNASYPNYFYCYQWKYTDGTYGWSGVTRDIATGESQERARTAITNASSAVSTAASAQATAESASTNANQAKENASSAVSLANTASTNASSALSTANTASSNASTALSTANSAASDASSAVSTANTAKATADKNVKTSLQLWFTKANETAPNKPTARVTSTSTDGNAWRVVVPTYSVNYPYYFYCYQYELADGTYTWSDVVYDRATTENQSNSRNAVTGVSTLTTKTNTISDTVDQHSQSISSLNTTVATKADNSTVTTLSNNLSTLEQDINTFKTTVSSTYSTKNELAEVQDDISDLQAGSKLSDTKSGNIITIDDALDAPPIDITVYGKSMQNIYSGKNLLDPSLYNNVTVGNNTYYTTNTDGSINVLLADQRGNAYVQNTLTLPAGTYTVSRTKAIGNWVVTKVSDYTTIAGGSAVGATKSLTFTLDTETEIFIKLSFGVASNNYPFKTFVQLETGSTATSYEPYTNKKPAPSPDYPQEINSVDDLTLHITGKNLCGGDFLRDSVQNAMPQATTGTDDAGDYIRFTGAMAQYGPTIVSGMFKPDTQYTFIIKYQGETAGNVTQLSVVYTDGTSQGPVKTGITAGTVTTATYVSLPNKTVDHLMSYWYSGATRIYYNECGIFEGILTETDFEAYTGKSIEIPLNNNKIRSLPSNDFDILKITYQKPAIRDGWGVFELNLEQKIGIGENTNFINIYKNTDTVQGLTGSPRYYMAGLVYNNKIISNRFLYHYAAYNYGSPGHFNGDNVYCFNPSTFTDVEEANTWLANNPIFIQYLLKESTYTNLGTIELPILFADILNIWADGGSAQPEISVDYWLNNAADIVPHLLDIDAVSKNNITAIETRVSTAESTIDQHSDSIALKANSSDVYTKTQSDGLIATEVTNRNAAITAATNAITLSVKETYTTKKETAALEAGSSNLITNLEGHWQTGALTNSVYSFQSGYGRIVPVSSENTGTVWTIEPDTYYIFRAQNKFDSTTKLYVGVHQQNSSGTHLKDSGWQICTGNGYRFKTLDNAATIKVVIRSGDPDGVVTTSKLIEHISNGLLIFTFSKDLETRISEAEASISVNADNIESKVSKDSVISSINQSAESVKIQASKVEIDGTAIFNSINSSVDNSISNSISNAKLVKTTQDQWYSSTSATTKAGGSWATTQPSIVAGRYIWQRQYVTYSDNTTAYLPSEAGICIQGQTDLSEYSTTTQMNSAIGTINTALENYKTTINNTLTSLQNQVDGQIEAWYKSVDPTTSNEPASIWNTTELKARHEGDIYYNVENGHSWRWMKSNSTYAWQQIPDSDAAAALAAAQNAQSLANSKRRIFATTPTVPYDVGDLWVDGTSIKYASVSKTTDQTYSESDWTVTATDDTLAQTALDTAGVVQDNLNATRTWYATCETAAATAVKVATITPETTAFELRVGVIVNVEFTVTDSADVANLKLNVNNTGEKFIKYMYNNTRSNLPGVGYLVAGIVYQFMYDGDYWTIQNMHYNTNHFDRTIHSNALKAASENATGKSYAIVNTSLIGYVDSLSGYQTIVSGSVINITKPLLWGAGNVAKSTTFANAYEVYPSQTLQNNVANWTGTAYNLVYLFGVLNGTQLTVDTNVFTDILPTEENGKVYIPIGILYSTYQIAFRTSSDLWAFVDGKFRQVNASTIVSSHRIYYRTQTANASLAAPTTWVEEATSNVYNQWTTKVPPLAVNTTAGQTKYLYLYTCEQRKRLDGTTLCTKVLLDENTTVIDGGSIITNSVTANQIAAGTITANEIAANTITADQIASNSITANEIDTTNLHVNAVNIDGTIAFGKLSGVQPSGDYALNSAIPTKVSDLTNDSGYQTSSQVDTIITGKNYATQASLNTEINQRKAQYGTSSTAAGTAAKAVTCANFELETGNEIIVKFTTANTSAAKVQLNVNSKGAKDIWVGNAVTSASNQLLWGANTYITFKYDGTQFQVIGEPRTWYGACTTAQATAAKAATITGCVVCKGAKVELAMTYANSAASPTLNISSIGAKNIYFGTGTTQPLISNGTSWLDANTATFTFDGAVWRTQGKTYIDANSIVTGYISADRIEAGSISGDKITGGTLAIGAFPSTTQADILNSNIHVPSTVAELTDSSTYATKTDAQGYANGKDSAIAAAAKRTDVSIAVTAINYTNNTATLQATLYIDGTATTSGVTYKWLKDGTVISGQTSRTLSVTSAMGLSHVYSCTVTYS